MNKPIKIYAEVLEEEALEQFMSAMKMPFSVKGALMPDAHYGYALPIGGVVATDNIIVPAWVGVDIGCGMVALQTPFKKQQIQEFSEKIFHQIYRDIPMGFNHNKEPQNWDIPKWCKMTPFLQIIWEEKKGLYQLGTLGGGNHFIEIGYDENNNVWIILHSGSRGIGATVAHEYMKSASPTGKATLGHFGFDIKSNEGQNYYNDMNFCLEFALENRKLMIEKIFKIIQKIVEPNDYKELESTPVTELFPFINRNHNHAWKNNGLLIHRKGATHAEKGMEGVIPGNMRDGSFIVVGKGNDDSLCSSSHGAGRIMSRTQANKNIDIDSFKESMEGITALVVNSTKDESAFAYKNIFEVMELQRDLVTVSNHIKPIINIKDPTVKKRKRKKRKV